MTYAQYEQEVKRHLTDKRFFHSQCVAAEAARLAQRYGADVEKARLAGILHDIMKDTAPQEQLKILQDSGIILTKTQSRNRKLWHSLSGAAYLRDKLGVADEEILSAVRCHTSGKGDMTLLEKVLFVADYISADRDYPGVEDMRLAADRSLEEAMVEGIRFTVNELMEQRLPVAAESIQAVDNKKADAISSLADYFVRHGNELEEKQKGPLQDWMELDWLFPRRPAEKRGHGKTRRLSGKERFAVKEYTAYHVVTERPMTVGQVLCLDETYPSGVYRRVMEKVPMVEEIYQNPGAWAGKPLEHHTMVALRELALEQVRREQFPQHPSRLHCLYVSETREEAQQWASFFASLGRPTYHIVKLQVRGRKFVGNANLCFDATVNQEENRRLAQRYWSLALDPAGQPPIWEILADGEIRVVEIVEEIGKNL